MDERRRRFDAQVMPHLDAAYRCARWLTPSPAEADDIVQDAMVRAYRGFGSLRGGDVRVWLLTIVRNCHFTSSAQQRRRGWVPLPDEDAGAQALVASAPGPEAAVINAEAGTLLEEFIRSMSTEHRDVLLLREIEDLSYSDIAQVLDIPIGTVMSRLARARAELRTRWLATSAGESYAVR